MGTIKGPARRRATALLAVDTRWGFTTLCQGAVPVLDRPARAAGGKQTGRRPRPEHRPMIH